MILLLAVAAGLLAGMGRAWARGSEITAPALRWPWLVWVALVPQLLAFYLPWAGRWLPDALAPLILVGSQLLLLVFAWANRRQAGIWLLGLGLFLNLLVIVLNGGLMPIRPHVVMALIPQAPPGAWQVGERLGAGKDIVLPEEATRLPWLSDYFLLPAWSPRRAAFSLGDVIIASGAFWFLWSLGGHATGTRGTPSHEGA